MTSSESRYVLNKLSTFELLTNKKNKLTLIAEPLEKGKAKILSIEVSKVDTSLNREKFLVYVVRYQQLRSN